MSFEEVMSWGSAVIALGVWAWALVTFFKTPKVGFASGLDRGLMLCLLIFTGIFGVLAWFFALRPLVRSRLIELRDENEGGQPAEPWRKHLIP